MSDITICATTTCEKRELCHRFTVIPNPFQQAYGQFGTDMQGNCLMFWPNRLAEEKEKK